LHIITSKIRLRDRKGLISKNISGRGIENKRRNQKKNTIED
jgi:hypothetical protein